MIQRILPMLLALVSMFYSKEALACADLQVSSLTITSVTGNSFKFTYVVKNVGTSTLYLNRMYFQAYVSQNSVYDTSDQPAGGAIFGDTAPALAPGQTYTGTWTSNPFVSITSYPYLVFRVLVRSGFSMPECSTTNNTLVRYIGCNLADVDVTSIVVNSVSGNSFNFTFNLRNLGWAALPLSKLYFQAWVSTDAVLDAGDKPAGGAIFGSTAPTLAKDGTYSRTWTSNPTVSIATYKYVIIEIREINAGTVPECNVNNNVEAKAIGCTLSDVDITSIVINSVSGNSFNFTFNLRNLGWTPLALSKMYFQAWVSTDAVLDASDKPAGGAIFGSTAPILAKDGTYSRTWTSNPAVSITTYKYVIIEIREINAGTVPECNVANNVEAKSIGCNLADVDVTSIQVNSITGNSFNFTFNLRNLGWAPLPLSKLYFQAWVSTDQVLDATDKPAGGAIFGSTAPTLAKDGTFSRTWTSNPTVSIATYKYLILEIRELNAGTVPECNTVNNVEVKLVVLPATVLEAAESLPEDKAPALRAAYSALDQTLTLSADHDHNVGYKIFRLDGQMAADVQEGTFVNTRELLLPNLPSGLYIVSMTDGSTSLTEKIVIYK